MRFSIAAKAFSVPVRAAALLAMLVACGSQTASEQSTTGGGSAGSVAAGGSSGPGGSHVDAGRSGGGAGGASGASTVDASAGDAIAEDGPNGEQPACDPVVTSKLPSAELDLINGAGPDYKWWVVTSAGQNEASSTSFMPPASPPAPSPATADGRTFLRMTGSGLGLVDYGILAFSPRASLVGGDPSDLSDGPGLTFDAKGTNLSIVIHTVDTVPRFCKCAGNDCFNGYRYKVAVTSAWATYTVTWNLFKLPFFVSTQPTFDPKNIVSISFGGLGEDFDISIDNLRVAAPGVTDGGLVD